MSELIDPPIVKGSSFLKRLFSPRINKLDLLRLAYHHYGEIFAFPAGKGQNVLIMAGQDVNRFVSKEGKDFFSSVEFWQGTLKEMGCPHSFIGVDGDAHQYQRQLMQPMFARAYFKDKINTLLQVVCDEVDKAVTAKEVLVAPLLRRILSKQIGGVLQDEMPHDKDIEAMMTFQITAINTCSLQRWPKIALKLPHYRNAKQRSKAFANRLIERARTENNSDRYLDKLMEQGERERPQWFTHGDLENHAIIPFLAGIDTVGASLGFMLYELVRHPEIKDRLQQEVDTFFTSEKISLATMTHMKQLSAFVKEVLRLYPTAFAIRRTVNQDFAYKGYQVKKGQAVTIFTTADHTNPRYFERPHELDIDRFLTGKMESVSNGVLSHFGRGPHTCLGSGLANVLMPLNLAFLLYTLNFEAGKNFGKVKVRCSPLANLTSSFALRTRARARIDFTRLVAEV
ncbi:cytochrome P450 [Xenorhabdus bovienii]|uniref:cytochrome P450 n=1 Tax=Xenorhabdus bovienii TaxID=40576 RepID=UPI0023B28349|nr:cytochrome P450 [Xenorhabdus bovienii]MDE9482424.1 cytochrome P450 [Xenorhabdus bovienii]MDE9556300.1 cytochrome P450 [Xenorhabdus bovienii]